MNTFFNRYFNEKDLDNQVYEITTPNGTMNLIETDMVIAKIKTTQGEEAKKIEAIIGLICFAYIPIIIELIKYVKY